MDFLIGILMITFGTSAIWVSKRIHESLENRVNSKLDRWVWQMENGWLFGGSFRMRIVVIGSLAIIFGLYELYVSFS